MATYQRKFIGSLDVAVNSETGAILVDGDVGLAAAANKGSSVSITNGSAQIAAANAARRALIITNLSTTRALTVALGTTAVVGSGIVLNPASGAGLAGGQCVISGHDYTGRVDGIMNGADATANNVSIMEI